LIKGFYTLDNSKTFTNVASLEGAVDTRRKLAQMPVGYTNAAFSVYSTSYENAQSVETTVAAPRFLGDVLSTVSRTGGPLMEALAASNKTRLLQFIRSPNTQRVRSAAVLATVSVDIAVALLPISNRTFLLATAINLLGLEADCCSIMSTSSAAADANMTSVTLNLGVELASEATPQALYARGALWKSTFLKTIQAGGLPGA
jgi:hypothetical protein